jgi:hypothetical protein
MWTRITSLPGCLGFVLVAALLISASPAIAQSNNNTKSQQIYLADPTPRAIDPHLLLNDSPNAGIPTQQALDRRNAKRRELVEWAANELVTLSERLEADVTRSDPGESLAAAQANAAKIEELAKNLKVAIKAQ